MTRRFAFLLPVVVFAGLVAVFAVGLTHDPHLVPSALIDRPAPDFALPALYEGAEGLSRKDLDSGVTLVNFFASWCAPCREEHGQLLALARRPGVTLDGIAYKDKPEDARRFLDGLGNPFRRIGLDRNGVTAIDFDYERPDEAAVIAEMRSFRERVLARVIARIVATGGIAFAVIYMGLWLRRWRNSRGIARRLVTPIAIASAVVCAATIAELIIAVTSAGARDLDQVYEIEAYLQIGVPLAFAVSVMRRRFARTRIVGLLLSLQGPARLPSITAALRSVFEDPRLEVVDWPSVPPVLLSPATRPPCRVPEPPGSVNGRLCLPIKSSSGEHLAAVLADPSLSPNDDLVQAALTASSFALENARLDEALRTQLQEVRDSRRRIIEAGTAERRRLERDLHDGTQQRLLGLKIMLATAEADIGDGAARAVVSRIRTELGDVLDELRDLAHGIHPAVLSQVGLAQAVQSLADRYTTPVQVDLPAGRLAESAELTAYFVIAESITNAIKHADAGQVTVTGLLADGLLRVEIADDGRGGASMSAGTGIRGLVDRVRGVGGDLVVESPPGRGTRIEARIPCA